MDYDGSLITDECYRAMGILALSFSNLDEQIGGFVTLLTGVKEKFVADCLMDKLTFGAKVERLRKLSKLYATTYGLESGDPYLRLREMLKELDRVALRRNSLFHGSASIDHRDGRWVVIVDAKRNPILLHVDEIAKILTDIDKARRDIFESFTDFWTDVQKQKG
jgi:hypothetical protein